jgi:uroporphyrinogen decarboxylase
MVKCLAGDPLDRVPVALWRHFPVEDQNPDRLARAVINFQKTYDFDFVKITPSSSFCVQDWGSQDEWQGNPEGSCAYIKYPVQNQDDWKLLQPPEYVKKALQTITQTTIDFIKSAKGLGIDGIFFAIQHAQANLLSPAEFDEFGIPFDIEILKEVQDLWLNVAHLHGSDVYFGRISQYPVDVINWHDQETAPDLHTGKLLFPGAVCGGLRQWETLVNGSPEDVVREARMAIEKTEGKRFILGTGCVLPITAPHSNIMAARKAVEL